MNSLIATVAGLFTIYTTIVTTVYCVDLHGVDVTKNQLISLTRDHFGRPDPDALLNGFFPVWAVIQLFLAAIFLVIALLSVVCYLVGCRTPTEERKKPIKQDSTKSNLLI